MEDTVKKATIFKRFSDWWHARHIAIRVITAIFITVAVLCGLAAIWLFTSFEIPNKITISAAALLVVTVLTYLFNHWKRRKTQTVITALISVLLCALIVITQFYWAKVVNKVYNYDDTFPKTEEEAADKLDAEPVIDDGITNIALFGIDTKKSESFSGNSDSIMIMSLDKKTKTVKLISIMRDSLVPIDRNGTTIYAKINSAYARGGAQLAVRTLNSIFNLDITEYATVNFFGMAKIIDAVGGIEASLTEDEVVPLGKGNYKGRFNACVTELCKLMGVDPEPYFITQSGVHHLNGIQAVGYSRIRYTSNVWGTSNDYGRTDRQRYVMEQLFNKALQMDVKEYPNLIRTMIPYTVTSLSPDEILGFALDIMTASSSFQQARIPQNDYLMKAPYGSFGSVVYYDLDFAADLIHAFIYENTTFEQYVAQNGIKQYNWYSNTGSGATGYHSSPEYIAAQQENAVAEDEAASEVANGAQ